MSLQSQVLFPGATSTPNPFGRAATPRKSLLNVNHITGPMARQEIYIGTLDARLGFLHQVVPQEPSFKAQAAKPVPIGAAVSDPRSHTSLPSQGHSGIGQSFVQFC